MSRNGGRTTNERSLSANPHAGLRSLGESAQLIARSAASRLAQWVLHHGASQQLERAQLELAESEARFAEVFERAPDVMAIVRSSDATVYEVNKAFEQASGYPREQIAGRSSAEFPWWARADERERILTALREGRILRDEEVHFFAPEGESVWLVSTSPMSFRGERCVVWRAVEITEKRRAEEEARALNERREQKRNLERLGMLAGGIAHDFNNLLVGVLGNADMVLAKLEPDSPYRAPLRAVVANAQRMAEHTRELLDYAGAGGSRLVPVQLDQVLEDAVELVRPMLPPNVTLLWKRPSIEVWIQGDAGQLGRMLGNLLRRAAKAHEGSPARIKLSLEHTGDRASVCIHESELVLDEVSRRRLFDPFGPQPLEGGALGLASVPGIVTRHGGTLDVEGASDRGTILRISFPLCRPLRPRTSTPEFGENLRGRRALVVDDEPQVRAVATAMLRHLGFEVTEAESGTRALEILAEPQQGEYALVLLDATMPGLDGAQTLERLRKMRPELPVLLCSGYSRTDFTQLLDSQPHTAFLTKPFRREQLGAAIRALLAPCPAHGPR